MRHAPINRPAPSLAAMIFGALAIMLMSILLVLAGFAGGAFESPERTPLADTLCEGDPAGIDFPDACR